MLAWIVYLKTILVELSSVESFGIGGTMLNRISQEDALWTWQWCNICFVYMSPELTPQENKTKQNKNPALNGGTISPIFKLIIPRKKVMKQYTIFSHTKSLYSTWCLAALQICKNLSQGMVALYKIHLTFCFRYTPLTFCCCSCFLAMLGKGLGFMKLQ